MVDSTPEPTDSDRHANRTRRTFLAGTAALALAGGAAVVSAGDESADQGEMPLTVRIENVSSPKTLETSLDGEAGCQPVPLSPGAYAVHTAEEPVFTADSPERDNGLEEIAEDGSPGRLAAALGNRDTVTDSGAFTTPVGADAPAPLLPGDAYEFTVRASPDRPTAYLSLVTMFIPSNDLYYALGGADGMSLFDGDDPMTGDVSDRVSLWDAGTEVNEEPGAGPNQAPRQRAAGVGLVERGTVAPIAEINGYDYPSPKDVIAVSISHGATGDDGTGMEMES